MSAHAKKIFLVGAGCFSPPTIMHLRMFDVGRDHLHSLGSSNAHRVIGGVLSPAHDKYSFNKPGLISSAHRVAMCRAAAQSSKFVRVSAWEAEQEEWTPTREALDAYAAQMKSYASGRIPRPEWIPPNANLADLSEATLYLLCGDDLLESFNTPGLWRPTDIEKIVRDYGLVVLSRGGKSQELVYKSDLLYRHRENILTCISDMGTDVSSTKVRLAIRRGKSVRYIVVDEVIEYIRHNNLYTEGS